MNIDYSASDYLTPMSKSLVLVFLPPLVPKFLWTQGCQPEIPGLYEALKSIFIAPKVPPDLAA